MTDTGTTSSKEFAASSLRWLNRAFASIVANNCMQRAAALSYTTVLSLVPFLALAFALLKGFGVPNKLAPLILKKVAAGSEELVTGILTYINNTNMKSLGAIGLVTLLYTVIRLISEIEEAFNAIWGISEARSWSRKFSDYLSVVVSGPLLLVAATSITTSLQSQALVQALFDSSYLGELLLFCFRLLPYLSIWAALTFLYLFLPNTKVQFSSALFGGIIAGTLWQVAQWGYIHLQIYMSSYNAIYGTMAVLPVFMIWIQTSWIIVLLGVELVYAHQHRNLVPVENMQPLSIRQQDLYALALACEVTRRFLASEPPGNEAELAAATGLPLLRVRGSLDQLLHVGILARTDVPSTAYLPASEPCGSTVADCLSRLHSYPEQPDTPLPASLAHLESLLTKKNDPPPPTLRLIDLLEKNPAPVLAEVVGLAGNSGNSGVP